MAETKKSFFESKLMRSKIKSATVSLFPEAALGFLLGPIFALMCNGIINTWLVQYWDKVLGLGQWAPAFEAILPIVSAIVIIVGNLLVGKLMERKPTRAGKARPLILLGMPIIAIALLVMFLVAPFPGTDYEELATNPNIATLAFVAIGYNLYYAIAWPIYYTSHSALVNLSTRDSGSRGLLSTCIMAAQLAASGVAGMAGGILVDLIGFLPKYSYMVDGKEKFVNSLLDIPAATEYQTIITPEDAKGKWLILMIVMVTTLIIGCLLEYFFSRERITEEQIDVEASQGSNKKEVKSVSIAEQAKICIHDKYWWLIIVFFFLYQFGGTMKNNGMSFYSQAMTGQNSLASLINTVGAIPTALGMAIVWPIARKIGKAKTITLGGFLALAGAALAFLALIPALNEQVFFNLLGTDLTPSGFLAVGSFIVKALGTAPAMYISLSVMGLVLDHQEAVHGIRTDGFTMAVYGSIMVAMAGVCNGIIVAINSVTPNDMKQIVHTFLAFGVEGICYAVMAIMFFFMNIEKFTNADKAAIRYDQKAEVLASGGTWVEPRERARLEQEENDRLVEEAKLAQLKADCEKKGLDYAVEEKKFFDAKEAKAKADAEKQAAADAKKAAAEALLSEEEKAARAAKKAEKEKKAAEKDQEALDELNKVRKAINRCEVSFER